MFFAFLCDLIIKSTNHLINKSLKSNKRRHVCSPSRSWKLVHLSDFPMCRRICLSVLSDSMLLTNINDWFVPVLPSVHLRYRSLTSFPYPFCVFLMFFGCSRSHWFSSPKHSWASGSEVFPWFNASSACGFAVEDAAGIASCTSTNPGKWAKNKLQACVYKFLFSTMFFAFLCDLIT